MSFKKINGYTINLEEELGRGQFGIVYGAQQDKTRIKCAVKMLNKMKIDVDDYTRSAIFREIEILENLRSENIVACFDVLESENYLYIVQELCDTDLKQLIEDEAPFSQDKALHYLKEICSGFLCLIKEGIVHRQALVYCRDLKPANIMMKNGVCKLGDFGLAKRYRNKRIKNDTSVGTPLYMSLQLLCAEKYTSKCDIWAIGCVFYEMLHGTPPWNANARINLIQQIQEKPLQINGKLSSEVKDFLKKCLERQESDRMDWNELFSHRLFKGHFQDFTSQNKACMNKLKLIMSDLRFRLNAQNSSLRDTLKKIGFSGKKQLDFKEFSEFIQLINPAVYNDEIVTFFELLDRNDDGKISTVELQNEMQSNRIPTQTKSVTVNQETVPKSFLGAIKSFVNQSTHDRFFRKPIRLDEDLTLKIKRCFIQLNKILNSRRLTLYKMFNAYDTKKKGSLGFKQMSQIFKKLDPDFSDQEITRTFEFMDKDESKTIEFSELNGYYCEVNGVPEMMDLPPEHYYAKGKVNYLMDNGNLDLSKFFKTQA